MILFHLVALSFIHKMVSCEERVNELDITTQLFYLMISMLRTSCGTVIHAPAAAECPTADEGRCYVSHTHLKSPNIC